MRNAQKKKETGWRKVLAGKRFNLFQAVQDAMTYEVSWKKASGSYGRRRFQADNIERAIERAPIVAGLEQEKLDAEGITLLEGFSMALKETRRGPRGRKDWIYQQTRFIDWVAREYPGMTHWHLVTRKVIKDYLHSMEGRAPNHKRLMFQPIIQTAGWLEREYQLPNVTGKLGIGSAIVRQTPTVFLVDVVNFLDHLQMHHPELETGAALQGLAALRVTEALRLTWGKVDMERGLIEVSGQTKTSWSNRAIPIAGRVLEALQRAWERRPNPGVYDPELPVVPNPSGGSYMTGFESYHNYTGPLRLAIREWNPKVGWQVKDLRNAVPTALAMAGLASDASEQYIGHAPKGITARHYIPRLVTVTQGEGEAFEKAMLVFKELVVDHVERLSQGTKILKIFDRGEVQNEADGA